MKKIYFKEEEWEVIAKREMRAYVLNLLENAGENIEKEYENLLNEIAVDVEVYKAIQETRIKSQKANPVLQGDLVLIDECPF